MAKGLQSITGCIGVVVSFVILAAIGGGAWFGYNMLFARRALEAALEAKEARIAELSEEVAAKARQIARLETAMRLLKVDHRVAYLDALDQQGSEKAGDLVTRFRFTEVDPDGKPLQQREFNIKGDVVHVDALVVKFEDKFVESGDDPLRATSMLMFRRAYGDQQKPQDGISLDRQGAQPAAYRGGAESSDFEREIWEKFWDYANDLEKQADKGIRAAHGQGVYQKIVPDTRYRLQLRASDGLSLKPEGPPPKQGQTL